MENVGGRSVLGGQRGGVPVTRENGPFAPLRPASAVNRPLSRLVLAGSRLKVCDGLAGKIPALVSRSGFATSRPPTADFSHFPMIVRVTVISGAVPMSYADIEGMLCSPPRINTLI